MNQQQRAVVQQALEALENRCGMDAEEREELMPALRQLLEQQPVQEPKFAAYWAVTDMEGKHIKVNIDTQRLEIYEEQRWAQANVQSNTKATLVYITRTTPPAQPAAWVGLTEEEIYAVRVPMSPEEIARAVEAKLREKNGGA
jgi:hypothetical protein